MKQKYTHGNGGVKPELTATSWPRHTVKSIDTRKRDLVIRIADWHRITTGTGGYDVECYSKGVYDWDESENFNTKTEAIAFAQKQIAKLL
jgi:hypothetical protein